ncbi:MAG: tetratricopeptide repeat protein [Agriterribacter sp.]
MRKKLSLIILFFCSFLLLQASLCGQVQDGDSLLQKLSDKNTTPTEKIETLNALSVLYSRDSTQQAKEFAHKAYLLSLQEKNKLLEARSLINLATTYLYNDNYDQALQYAFRSLDLSIQEKSKPDIAYCYKELGWVFFDSENYDFSMQYHRQAYDLYGEIGERKKSGVAANAIGLVYRTKGQCDSARTYFDIALAIAQETNNYSGEAAALNNIGICENDQGRHRQAIVFFNRALATKEAKDNILLQAEIFNQLAEANIGLKSYADADAALANAKRLIDRSTSNMKKEKQLDYLYNYSLLYKAQNRFAEAYLYLQEYNAVKKQVISDNKSEAIAAMKMERETMQKEAAINALEAQKKLRAFQRNALAAGIVLLIIIGILLFNRIHHQRKKEKELAAIKEEMIKKELANTLLEKTALSAKLEYKNAALKNSALFISQRNDMIRDFIDELLRWQKETPKEYSIGFSRLLNKFQHTLEANQDIQDLNRLIEETNKDFFFNLLAKFPNLTENEKKLCAQIRLNLSIKDIASLNNISVKSAEMARYRLRKHFELKYEDSLNDFLKQF